METASILGFWNSRLDSCRPFLFCPVFAPDTDQRRVSPDCIRHHPVLRNRRFPGRVKTGRFCGDFRLYLSVLSVSGDTCGFSGRFQPPVSASKNSVPHRRVAAAKAVRELGNLGSFWDQNGPFEPGPYRGFSPRASNCRLHSAGASRSRSTPIPRGKRPSTAARTRSGARNASEIVMLT